MLMLLDDPLASDESRAEIKWVESMVPFFRTRLCADSCPELVSGYEVETTPPDRVHIEFRFAKSAVALVRHVLRLDTFAFVVLNESVRLVMLVSSSCMFVALSATEEARVARAASRTEYSDSFVRRLVPDDVLYMPACFVDCLTMTLY